MPCLECRGEGTVTIRKMRQTEAQGELDPRPADTFRMPKLVDAAKDLYVCPTCKGTGEEKPNG